MPRRHRPRVRRKPQHSKNAKRPRKWHRTVAQDDLFFQAVRRVRQAGVRW